MGTRSGLNKAARSTLTGLAGLSDNIITKDDKLIMGVENVAGGNGSGNSVTLDADATFSFRNYCYKLISRYSG